jgi:ornithine cyclodeaminase/alanine dehydrogenase-like protein (mu-crystallin family)
MRTSAVSAVAAKYLSPPDAAVVGMYGAGRQAEGQLEAICKVRPIRKAIVYSRRPDARAAFCARMSERLGIEVVAAGEPHEAAVADIIVTITNSEDPVLMGAWITRPALIIAAGANHWYKRELDLEAVACADLIVTDEKEQSKVEGGNLLYAIGHGRLSWDRVEELGDVVTGRVPLPNLSTSVRLFCSHGLAIEDVAISVHALRRAREQGLGQHIEI